jgi:dihydrofolate synthase/folylpolyglutamate synthase
VTYEEILSYLYEQLPMFTRIGSAAYKKDLTNTIALCDTLGNPQQSFKSIHIAGTNGKGSTSHMLAAILQEAGYKTGLYTSPHLIDFRERIRVNGQMIEKEYVQAFVLRNKQVFEQIKPSFFEWTVALAFDYFAHQKVDIAVIETGLGGRLDSTNIIMPILSIITNIGWDHMDMLGDTLPKIAAEKAGIIKPNIPVVISSYHEETLPVFEQKATQVLSPLTKAYEHYQVLSFRHVQNGEAVCEVNHANTNHTTSYNLQLGGIYQQFNLPGVLAAANQLNEIGYTISETAIRNGLSNTVKLTSLLGRWQVLQHAPLVVCDTAHNVNGFEMIVSQLNMQSFTQLHVVLGMVKDKDISKILALLPSDAYYYFCNANLPRSLPAVELLQAATPFNLIGNSYNSVADAYKEALKNANEQDMIYVGGSTFVVAEVLTLLA